MSATIQFAPLFPSTLVVDSLPIPTINPCPKTTEFSAEISSIIERTLKNNGVNNILQASESDREKVRQEIYGNQTWGKAFERMYPTISSANIPRPWWNEQLCYEINPLRTNGTGLEMEVGHSYEVQLVQRKLSPRYPISLVGITETSDNLIVVGLRGGANLANSFMLAPAGYLGFNADDQQRHPLLNTLLHESEEELGIDALPIEQAIYGSDIQSTKLILRMEGGRLSQQPHYVIKVKLTIPYATLLQRWGSNEHTDKIEHRLLCGVEASQKGITRFIKDNKMSYAAITGQPELVAARNTGRLLPHATKALIGYLRHTAL